MTRQRGTGHGFRKAILVNEHFVVYGVPAIAVPVFYPVEVTVTIEGGDGIEVRWEQAGGETVMAKPDSDLVRAMQAVLRGAGEPGRLARFCFFCRDDLPGWSGLGSSAAFCVAAVRAVCRAKGMAPDDETVNENAYEGEKIFASNPSGIDNTVATYGRAVWYERGSPEPCSFVSTPRDLHLVVGNSGMPSLTRVEVDRVAEYRRKNPETFRRSCREAEGLAVEARNALDRGDLSGLGGVMQRAHGLLGTLGVSNAVLDRMTDVCLERGALGAKLTGAGGGGCMLALAPDPGTGEEIAAGLREKGYEAFVAPPGLGSGMDGGGTARSSR